MKTNPQKGAYPTWSDLLAILGIYLIAMLAFNLGGGLLLRFGIASQGPVVGRCRLTDENGSTLCARFHWIDYSVFDDGYIGIAVCYGERAAYPCYDEDGQPMPEGYWLVDWDGKLCSERFAKLSFGDSDETHAASEDDVLRALREDGTEELLLVAELLLP